MLTGASDQEQSFYQKIQFIILVAFKHMLYGQAEVSARTFWPLSAYTGLEQNLDNVE